MWQGPEVTVWDHTKGSQAGSGSTPQHFSSSPVLLRQVRSRHLLATAAVDFLVLLYSGLTTITVLGYLHWFSPLVELQLRGDFATP